VTGVGYYVADGAAMRPMRQTFRAAAHRLLAVALGLWLSGAGCLVCCERTKAAAHDLLGAIREAERATPSADEHSCCKARVGTAAQKTKEKATTRDSASESDAPGAPEARRATVPGRACCRRVLRTAEQARKARVEPAQAEAPSAHAPTRHTPAAARAQTSPPARARAPDREGTYLVCCAFLI
jgi:hypothetical protein